MYFCFDLLGENPEDSESGPSQTVAVTCPQKELTETPQIRKCCPHGEVLDEILDNCVSGNGIEKNIKELWRLPINGHVYNGYAGELYDKKIIAPYKINTMDTFYVGIQIFSY